MKIKRILVPVDFSEYSDAAVRIAASLARRQPTTITLLHVLPPRNTGIVAIEPMFAPPRVMETLYQERAARADNELEALEGLLRKVAGDANGLDIALETATGSTLEVILEYAHKPCDLIIMGSHGLTGAARFLLGSTAEKVSRKAPCPVLITPSDDLDRDQLPRIESVMVGIDYSPFSAPAIRLASVVAEPEADIELIHVWSPPLLASLEASTEQLAHELTDAVEQQRAAEADRLAAFAAELDFVGVETFVASGAVTHALIERAEETNPDLIVLGSHGRDTITEKILGTVADRVLRHAGRPVLLLPPEARDVWAG